MVNMNYYEFVGEDFISILLMFIPLICSFCLFENNM